MNNAYTLRERRFKEWYHWKPAKGTVCPRRVAGKRCVRFNFGQQCICAPIVGGIFDHTAIWKDEKGQLIYTTEPYHCDGTDLATFVEQLKPLGLQVEILPRSGWFPDHTILIAVTLKGVPEYYYQTE